MRRVLRSDRSRRSLKNLVFSNFFRPSLRHPIPPVFQFPRSATVTPAGVLAMRDRRGCEGQDAKPSPPGSRKMVSLWRHGGNGRRRIPACYFISELARQAHLCDAHGEWWFGLRRLWSVRFHPGRRWLRGSNHHSRQRDRSRGQKPLNGALRGVTYYYHIEAAFSAPTEYPVSRHDTAPTDPHTTGTLCRVSAKSRLRSDGAVLVPISGVDWK